MNNEGVAGVLCQAESGGFCCVVGDPFKGAVESGGHPKVLSHLAANYSFYDLVSGLVIC